MTKEEKLRLAVPGSEVQDQFGNIYVVERINGNWLDVISPDSRFHTSFWIDNDKWSPVIKQDSEEDELDDAYDMETELPIDEVSQAYKLGFEAGWLAHNQSLINQSILDDHLKKLP
jgi:hypothetical protein